MSHPPHHIDKVCFDLRLYQAEEAFSLQQKVSTTFNGEVCMAMSDLFDQLIPADQQLSIDKMEIELGAVSISELANGTFKERILRSLKEKLQDVTAGRETDVRVKRSTLPEHAFERWLTFLSTGHLPWTPDQPEAEWKQLILEALVRDMVHTEVLRRWLFRAESALKRLVRQYDDSFLVSLLEVFSGMSLMRLPSRYSHMYHRLVSDSSTSDLEGGKETGHTTDIPPWPLTYEGLFREVFWMFMLEEVILREERVTAEALMEKFSDHIIRILRRSRSSGRASGKSSVQPTDPAVLAEEGGLVKTERRETSDRSEWYIEHAGVILLHPFLASFFERLELVESGAFWDDQARMEALHLIHYLASGQKEPPEYELLLAKVLCGVSLNLPVERWVSLSEEFMEEADHLLKVVVKQWQVLGEVSPDALREGFLNRPGKLSCHQGKWSLQVEQGAIDVLLDRLPWGISLVKTPWMKEIMTVEWR